MAASRSTTLRPDGELAARAYLLTFGQLSDVVAQEARRPVGSDLALDDGVERRWPVGGSHVYETLLHVGDREGLPMFTITSLQNLEPTPPSAPYLRTMLDGLGEAFGWTTDERVRYLLRARRRHAGVDGQPTRRAVRRRA